MSQPRRLLARNRPLRVQTRRRKQSSFGSRSQRGKGPQRANRLAASYRSQLIRGERRRGRPPSDPGCSSRSTCSTGVRDHPSEVVEELPARTASAEYEVGRAEQRSVLVVPAELIGVPGHAVAELPVAGGPRRPGAEEGIERSGGALVGRRYQRAAGTRRAVARSGFDAWQVGFESGAVVALVVVAAELRTAEKHGARVQS